MTENLKWLAEGIKYLPNIIQNLTLNMFFNNLGENA